MNRSEQQYHSTIPSFLLFHRSSLKFLPSFYHRQRLCFTAMVFPTKYDRHHSAAHRTTPGNCNFRYEVNHILLQQRSLVPIFATKYTWYALKRGENFKFRFWRTSTETGFLVQPLSTIKVQHLPPTSYLIFKKLLLCAHSLLICFSACINTLCSIKFSPCSASTRKASFTNTNSTASAMCVLASCLWHLFNLSRHSYDHILVSLFSTFRIGSNESTLLPLPLIELFPLSASNLSPAH